MKLDNEPRLQGAGPAIMEWARKVVSAVNQVSDWVTGTGAALVAAIGPIRTGATPIIQTLDAPAFSVYANVARGWPGGTPGGTLAIYDVKEFDTGNCFDLSTNRFTPNVPGYYQINGQWLSNVAGTVTLGIFLRKNGGNIKRGTFLVSPSTTNLGPSVSALVQMNGTTDYIDCVLYSSVANLTYVAEAPIDCYLQGFLARRA